MKCSTFFVMYVPHKMLIFAKDLAQMLYRGVNIVFRFKL